MFPFSSASFSYFPLVKPWLYPLESASSSGASMILQTIVIPVDPPVQVDNTTTSYRLRVAPGVASSAHLLRGARVGYTLPLTYLPLITK